MDAVKKYEERIYYADKVAWFRKTKEQYGGLSNMASGYPIIINGVHILSVEALYQACRFPHLSEIQKKILSEKSPMSAKMVSKPYREQSRPDWEEVKIKIMRWCLRVKLAQNFIQFGKVLESTFDKLIVEDSKKDDFWGAIRDKENPNIFKGTNALGRLLMELRQKYNESRFSLEIFYIEPLNIPDFKLLGKNITTIDERINFLDSLSYKLKINISSSVMDKDRQVVEQVNVISQVQEQQEAYRQSAEKDLPITKEEKQNPVESKSNNGTSNEIEGVVETLKSTTSKRKSRKTQKVTQLPLPL